MTKNLGMMELISFPKVKCSLKNNRMLGKTRSTTYILVLLCVHVYHIRVLPNISNKTTDFLKCVFMMLHKLTCIKFKKQFLFEIFLFASVLIHYVNKMCISYLSVNQNLLRIQNEILN